MFLISRPSKSVDVFPGLFVNPAARAQHMCSACMSRCSMIDLSFLNNVRFFSPLQRGWVNEGVKCTGCESLAVCLMWFVAHLARTV